MARRLAGRPAQEVKQGYSSGGAIAAVLSQTQIPARALSEAITAYLVRTLPGVGTF